MKRIADAVLALSVCAAASIVAAELALLAGRALGLVSP
jgi:hypothetical protein